MAMTAEVRINGTAAPTGRYVTWAPSPCNVRLTDADGATTPVDVIVQNQTANAAARFVFRAAAGAAPTDTIELRLSPAGAPKTFLAAGKWGFASRSDRDAVIQVRRKDTGAVIATVPSMIRVRKDANTLTAAERDRFLRALARLNDAGRGAFQTFRDTHKIATVEEAHFDAGFLPWHRAFLLDLERALQQIDPSVSLPYWRFDQPAPSLFRTSFIGTGGTTGVVAFSSTNPLRAWSTDGFPGIARGPFFNTQTQGARDQQGRAVLTETSVTGHTGNQATLPNPFESNPHGRAHVSFRGFIYDIDTAAKDPLFYLLHCNVDRLWAKWQWLRRRVDKTSTATYPFLGKAGQAGAARVGHNLLDTMWPWNNIRTAPRPGIAPRPAFPSSPVASAPGAKPTVGAMIDYQGKLKATERLGFDYDDVPFEQP
jgi:tyrosinase